jgi:transcriptional regulator with XRE-family HTH domain
MDAMTTFCNNVMSVLSKKGWTIQDLADKCGLDRSNLSKVLRAKEGCTLLRAEKIADALGVPLSTLVDKSAKFFSKVS